MTDKNTLADETTSVANEHEGIGRSFGKSTPSGKRGIVTGVVVAIIVVAGAGMLVWHEQPSFCAAICHTPMDAYYETYANGTTDKLGNPIDTAEKTSMLSYQHKGYNNTTCMDCHVPTLGEQVSEGVSWLSGNYAVFAREDGTTCLETRTLADLTEARGVNEVEFCLNDACHPAAPDRTSLAEKTERFGSEYNPHLERHGEIDCGTCHKAHTQSVNYCTECHASAPVPEGWLSMAQARKMGIVE